MPVDYSRRHVRFGWWSFLLFTVLGLALEVLHGFKVAAYLAASNETRRLMWTLAHAHGTLLGVVHVLFGLTVRVTPELAAHRSRLISRCLIAASVLLPGGFFLGGVVSYGGDPGLSVVLVPVGAMALMIAVFVMARSSPAAKEETEPVAVGGAPRGRRK